MRVYVGGIEVQTVGETKLGFSLSDDQGQKAPASGVFFAPFNAVNDKAFRLFRVLGSTTRFNTEKVAGLIEDRATIMKGVVSMVGATDGYRFFVVGDSSGWRFRASEELLSETDLSDLTHTYEAAAISSAPAGEYIYPFFDRGRYGDLFITEVEDDLGVFKFKYVGDASFYDGFEARAIGWNGDSFDGTCNVFVDHLTIGGVTELPWGGGSGFLAKLIGGQTVRNNALGWRMTDLAPAINLKMLAHRVANSLGYRFRSAWVDQFLADKYYYNINAPVRDGQAYFTNLLFRVQTTAPLQVTGPVDETNGLSMIAPFDDESGAFFDNGDHFAEFGFTSPSDSFYTFDLDLDFVYAGFNVGDFIEVYMAPNESLSERGQWGAVRAVYIPTTGSGTAGYTGTIPSVQLAAGEYVKLVIRTSSTATPNAITTQLTLSAGATMANRVQANLPMPGVLLDPSFYLSNSDTKLDFIRGLQHLCDGEILTDEHRREIILEPFARFYRAGGSVTVDNIDEASIEVTQVPIAGNSSRVYDYGRDPDDETVKATETLQGPIQGRRVNIKDSRLSYGETKLSNPFFNTTFESGLGPKAWRKVADGASYPDEKTNPRNRILLYTGMTTGGSTILLDGVAVNYPQFKLKAEGVTANSLYYGNKDGATGLFDLYHRQRLNEAIYAKEVKFTWYPDPAQLSKLSVISDEAEDYRASFIAEIGGQNDLRLVELSGYTPGGGCEATFRTKTLDQRTPLVLSLSQYLVSNLIEGSTNIYNAGVEGYVQLFSADQGAGVIKSIETAIATNRDHDVRLYVYPYVDDVPNGNVPKADILANTGYLYRSEPFSVFLTDVGTPPIVRFTHTLASVVSLGDNERAWIVIRRDGTGGLFRCLFKKSGNLTEYPTELGLTEQKNIQSGTISEAWVPFNKDYAMQVAVTIETI